MVRPQPVSLPLLLLVSLVSLACTPPPTTPPAPDGAPAPEAAPETVPEADPAPVEPSPPQAISPKEPLPEPGVGSVAPELWDEDPRVVAARADLAAILAVAASTITVTLLENVRWNNGAMGCPKPDMAYAQAIVDGYRIVLEHGGKRYAYHGRDGHDPFLCE